MSFVKADQSYRRSLQHFAASRFGVLLLALILLLVAVGPIDAAQSYRFNVPELRMQVFVLPDASARIVYDITFENEGGLIDIVDIGLPHGGFDFTNMSASIDGATLDDIRVSEYVEDGVEIHLHDRAIGQGRTGTIHFEATMPDMVYQDTTRDDYASLQIGTTWFDQQFLTGNGNVWILVHMLPDILPEEVLFQDVPFTNKVIFEEHPVAVWQWENVQPSGTFPVGVSFPQRGMSRVIAQSLLDLTNKWFEDHPGITFFLAGAILLLMAIAFFRFSGGTGISVFVILAIGIVAVLVVQPASILLVLPASIVLFALNETYISRRKRRYLPAIAQVEGGGIKRGLTAPEAAILLELPLNKVLMLIIFGLLEKSVVAQVQDSPLTVEVRPEYEAAKMSRKKRRAHRLAVAQRLGIVLRSYEHAFIDRIEESPGKPVHKLDLSEPMKALIEHTARRMKGFDLSDTQEYYRKIIARAMSQAQSIGDVPELERYVDRHLQWLLLDEAYPTILTTRRYHYRPIWVRPFASSDRLGIPAGPGKSSPASPGGRTSFGDVAASFAGWTENTMGSMASAISPDILQVEAPAGMVNLSGADKVTGDIFKALTTSSGGGGSSGGGCACACAGCACACACAGGGR
ncbi:MAG: hypothetical protein JSW55_14945 [Chloroflexota bacterium]|nr:MAG: hypothetical protein JSW55_14945 [Chloroflexota bacterium]